MLIEDEEVKKLCRLRQINVRQFDRKEITEEEFKRKDREYFLRTKELSDAYIKQKEKEFEDLRRKRLEGSKMPEGEEVVENKEVVEKEVKEKKAGKPRGPKPNSYAALILKVLQMKTVKSLAQAAETVNEKKPGRDIAKIKAQISAMIREVKNGKKKGYTWDAEEYLLTPVEAE